MPLFSDVSTVLAGVLAIAAVVAIGIFAFTRFRRARRDLSAAAGDTLPPRPEFYDPDMPPAAPGAAAQRALRSLSYVVFDTETTGLRPSLGDEIVAIAGVRVIDGRVDASDTFNRLVNPGRGIPKQSTRFHGITDDMVRHEPPLAVVLPQFKAFIGDSVLVAHNAAFDMKFLKMKEAELAIRFDNPVLDTLLISAFLFDTSQDHSLDAVLGRFDIPALGRHTALGDALATAAAFIRLIEILEDRGIGTFERLLRVSNMAMEVRVRQARF